MIRRRHKLYFEKTASKLPIIVFSISVVIGGFFLFRIIHTLVTESGNTVELATVDTGPVAVSKMGGIDAKIVTSKDIAKQSPSSSKSSVKSIPVKTTETVQNKQTQPSAVVSEFYTIQVATFKDKNSAESLVKKLKGNKFSPLYIKTKGKLFEVCVGKFENSAKGKETLSSLKKDFHDAFTIKLQSPFEEK